MAVHITADQLRHAERSLAGVKNGARKAAFRAINRSMTAGKTRAVDEASATYTVRKTQVRDTITTTKATTSNLSARVTSRGKAISLAEFQTKPRRPMHDGKKVLLVNVKRDTGFKPIQGAFLAISPSTSRLTAYIRQSKARLPIRQLYGPSIPQMLDEPRVRDSIDTRAREVLSQRFDHEIGRILEKGR